MNQQVKFPYQEELLNLAAGEEFIVFISGRAFIVKPAAEDDVERIGHGYFCMD